MKYAKNCKPNSKNTGEKDSKAKKGKGVDARAISRTITDFDSVCRLYRTRQRASFPKAIDENSQEVRRKS